ncbi:Uma2 family endonuclease [Pseudanabaena mucicola]|uniref:Uma2 family endonuclease n=1 Tax=Pseudanabaena mucicola FACHB-723 TaxID=2692860 RepID=A0ABR7ZYA1_9CYAN|nr:Uma2 family endonuclease [Pseudanabaena mucicola]MBD2188973.1 Uma2 family endonuclease [Pseudanabaena mucicola FACHB-723]
MTVAAPVKVISPAEYLNLEVKSTNRHEYRQGEIIEMTGGTPTHNEIIGALTVILRVSLKGKPLQVFVTDQRLFIPDRQAYTYPDVMVVSRPIALQEGRKDTVTEPILIVEVLSNSTKNYDRGEKFADYRSIPSFQEYLLIDQTKPHVEHYLKQGANQWLLREYSQLENRLELTSLGIEISLSEIYENVEF